MATTTLTLTNSQVLIADVGQKYDTYVAVVKFKYFI